MKKSYKNNNILIYFIKFLKNIINFIRMSRVIDEPFDIRAERLVEKVVDGLIEYEKEDYDFDGGQGRFIKYRTGGCIIACCFHKTKRHKAWVEVHNSVTSMFGFGDEVKRSSDCEAPAGKWAVAWCDSGKFGGNEAYYKCWDD